MKKDIEELFPFYSFYDEGDYFQRERRANFINTIRSIRNNDFVPFDGYENLQDVKLYIANWLTKNALHKLSSLSTAKNQISLLDGGERFDAIIEEMNIESIVTNLVAAYEPLGLPLFDEDATTATQFADLIIGNRVLRIYQHYAGNSIQYRDPFAMRPLTKTQTLSQPLNESEDTCSSLTAAIKDLAKSYKRETDFTAKATRTVLKIGSLLQLPDLEIVSLFLKNFAALIKNGAHGLGSVQLVDQLIKIVDSQTRLFGSSVKHTLTSNGSCINDIASTILTRVEDFNFKGKREEAGACVDNLLTLAGWKEAEKILARMMVECAAIRHNIKANAARRQAGQPML